MVGIRFFQKFVGDPVVAVLHFRLVQRFKRLAVFQQVVVLRGNGFHPLADALDKPVAVLHPQKPVGQFFEDLAFERRIEMVRRPDGAAVVEIPAEEFIEFLIRLVAVRPVGGEFAADVPLLRPFVHQFVPIAEVHRRQPVHALIMQQIQKSFSVGHDNLRFTPLSIPYMRKLATGLLA